MRRIETPDDCIEACIEALELEQKRKCILEQKRKSINEKEKTIEEIARLQIELERIEERITFLIEEIKKVKYE